MPHISSRRRVLIRSARHVQYVHQRQRMNICHACIFCVLVLAPTPGCMSARTVLYCTLCTHACMHALYNGVCNDATPKHVEQSYWSLNLAGATNICFPSLVLYYAFPSPTSNGQGRNSASLTYSIRVSRALPFFLRCNGSSISCRISSHVGGETSLCPKLFLLGVQR